MSPERISKTKSLYIFGPPEPKAHKVSLKYNKAPSTMHLFLCLCVHTFEQEYLKDWLANLDKISQVPSLGGELAVLGFGADLVRSLVSTATRRSHRHIIGKMLSGQ